MILLKKITVPLIMLAWCTYFIVDAGGLAKKGNTFVFAVYVVMLVLGAVELYNEFRRAQAEKRAMKGQEAVKKDKTGLIRSGIFFACTITYVLCVNYIGFVVSSVAYLFAMFTFLGGKNKIVVIAASVIVTLVLYLAFDYLLGVPLPHGLLI